MRAIINRAAEKTMRKWYTDDTDNRSVDDYLRTVLVVDNENKVVICTAMSEALERFRSKTVSGRTWKVFDTLDGCLIGATFDEVTGKACHACIWNAETGAQIDGSGMDFLAPRSKHEELITTAARMANMLRQENKLTESRTIERLISTLEQEERRG